MASKPFYSPRQKSTEHKQHDHLDKRFEMEADLGLALERGSCGRNTDNTKSGGSSQEPKGILDDIEEGETKKEVKSKQFRDRLNSSSGALGASSV